MTDGLNDDFIPRPRRQPVRRIAKKEIVYLRIALPEDLIEKLREAIAARPKHLAIPVDVEDVQVIISAADAVL